MKHMYGEFSSNQIEMVKKSLRGSIFLLLLCLDPETKEKYTHINVEDCFNSVLYKTSGLNTLLFEPKHLVEVLCLLREAKNEYEKPHVEITEENKNDNTIFQFKVYRKLILDAGAEILKVREGE